MYVSMCEKVTKVADGHRLLGVKYGGLGRHKSDLRPDRLERAA